MPGDAATATRASSATPLKCVLVVEDDAEIRSALESLLQVEGYEVVACANGLEALQRLRAGIHVDVILLDLMMPVMDGWQFRVHQKNDPTLASLPVIAISADNTPKAAAIDADEYLRKPVDYDTLIDAIARTLIESERRQQQAKFAHTERLATLGTLAAGVAHEINNPLAFVMSNLAFLSNALPQLLAALSPHRAEGVLVPEDAQVHAALKEAREGCERIRAIVSDVQLFSRPTEEEKRAVDVRKALDSSINVVLGVLRNRARLTKDYADVPMVLGNEGRLGQVFLNLLLNAAQAIPEGDPDANEVRVVVRAEGGFVVVEVQDTGCGIRPEVRARIFDPFYTTKPIGVGTGLGLSISHGIVQSMGGNITVGDAPGASSPSYEPGSRSGTLFRVLLPVAKATARDVLRVVRQKEPARARASVLVVDDEEMIGLTLCRALGRAHDVRVTTDAREALLWIDEGARFDVILCDLMMPLLSGMDMYEVLQERHPDQAARIVFLTGGAFTSRAHTFRSDVKNEFIEKPFDVEKLLALISSRAPPTK